MPPCMRRASSSWGGFTAADDLDATGPRLLDPASCIFMAPTNANAPSSRNKSRSATNRRRPDPSHAPGETGPFDPRREAPVSRKPSRRRVSLLLDPGRRRCSRCVRHGPRGRTSTAPRTARRKRRPARSGRSAANSRTRGPQAGPGPVFVLLVPAGGPDGRGKRGEGLRPFRNHRRPFPPRPRRRTRASRRPSARASRPPCRR
jgi:hypothetical protein